MTDERDNFAPAHAEHPEDFLPDPAESPVTPAPAHAVAPAHAALAAEPEPLVPIDAVPDPVAPASPEDTAEIDVDAVEAKLNDPGSTTSFEPITDDLIDTDSTFEIGRAHV